MKIINQNSIRHEIIDPIQDSRYLEYINKHSQSTIYHHPLWKTILENTFRQFKSEYIAFLNEKDDLVGIIPGFICKGTFNRNSYISAPMLTYCDPLFNDTNIMLSGIKSLTEEIKKGHYKSMELRSLHSFPVIDNSNFQLRQEFTTHILKLNQNMNNIFQGFHKTSIQQRIKQAERNGLILKFGESIEDINTFFKLLSMTRKKLGLFSLPYDFFKNMWTTFYQENSIKLLMVYNNEECIAAMIVLKFKNKAYSEYTGTNPRYLNLHPNHFIIYKAIEHAINEELSEFDFGRSSLQNKGLIGFKDRWNGERKILSYYYFPYASPMNLKNQNVLAIKVIKSILKKMPLGVLQFGGKIYYNYLNN